ncbi:MAG: LuxR C-terminal-related transcriptional regulator [Planctomycetota bacterium]
MSTEPIHLPSAEAIGPPHVFFAFDEQSRIRYVSPSVRELLGYGRSNIIGHQVTRFLSDDHELNADAAECIQHRFESSYVGNRSFLRSLASADGDRRVFRVTTWGVITKCKKVVSVHGMATDVSIPFQHHRAMSARLKALDHRRQRLSPREREILGLVISGKLNKQIAKSMQISTRTVEDAKRRMIDRFDVNRFAEVAALEIEHRTLHSAASAMTSFFDGCDNVVIHVESDNLGR